MSYLREIIKNLLGHHCYLCGHEGMTLNIHHLDGNPRNNNLRNIVLLCSPCHRKVHRRKNPKSVQRRLALTQDAAMYLAPIAVATGRSIEEIIQTIVKAYGYSVRE